MATTHADFRPRRIALVLAAAVLLTGTAGAVLLGFGAAPVAGQSDVSVDSFQVADANRTVDGDVSDVTLTADLAFSQDVPDATERIVKLRAGPSDSDLTTLAFDRTTDVAANESGTVTLSGSLLDAGFTAEEFDPATAGTTERTVAVEVVVEVTRADGETVTERRTDTATVTLHDSGDLTVALGGSGEFTVTTD